MINSLYNLYLKGGFSLPNLSELWENIFNHFQKDYDDIAFSTWFTSIIPESLHEKTLVLRVPSPLHKQQWDNRVGKDVLAYLKQNFQTDFKILALQEGEDNPYKKEAELADQEPEKPAILDFNHSTKLDPAYTFESFVVGSGNQMAHAAALSVSEEPGTLYNPLYFYGGVGLGKTHLMHAIGHQLLKNNPNAKVKYVSSETFINDFIKSVQGNTRHTDEFRKAYRSVDLLLVDDVQFFAKKPGTIDEFFHTFNDLYDSKKQIVLSSDRLPNEIEGLGDRLISRFRWGLAVEITPPDFKTRIEILRKKSSNEGISIPEEALDFLAGKFDSNVRDLEGGLNQVRAFSRLKNSPITPSLVTEALGNLGSETPSKASLDCDTIIHTVAKYYNVTEAEIKGKKRIKRIVVPRQIAMYFARELTNESLPKIGRAFGGKDHTTVLHACEKVATLIETDEQISSQIKELTAHFS